MTWHRVHLGRGCDRLEEDRQNLEEPHGHSVVDAFVDDFVAGEVVYFSY